MVRFRVKAFFMHEDEEAAARDAQNSAILTDTDWTAGYVLGVIDEQNIQQLVARGLVITPVEQIEPSGGAPQGRTASRSSTRKSAGAPATAGLRSAAGPGLRPLSVSVTGKSADAKILSSDTRRIQYYVVRLHGPLVETRREALAALGIQLLERLSSNTYKARLNAKEVKDGALLDFVDTIRLYTDDETLSDSTRAVRSSVSSGAAPHVLPHAVRLHRAEDLKKVVAWLRRRGRQPISANDDVVRVALIQGGNDVIELAKLPEVAAIDEILPTRLLDRIARGLIGIEHAGGQTIGLEGEGQLIGVADTGLDDSHPDFANRIVGISALGRINDHSDPEGHGTHVAGCALGDGSKSDGEIRGAAPKAKLFFQSILDAAGGLGGLPNNLKPLFQEAYDNGVRIHNNSWGAFTYARYDATSRDVDRFVYDNPDMLIVIAAGNDGIAVPRVAGADINADIGFVDWPSVAAPATAKNALTVGASRSTRTKGGYSNLTWGKAWADRYPKKPIANETVSGDENSLAAFSSRGPTEGTQIKPDVVAPGTDIAAARSSQAPLYKFWGAYPNNDQYAFMGGTSMAAPYVAGCAALVREYYVTRANWPTPSAALLKATLINGTRRLTGADATAKLQGEPNFHQGFGCIDMASSIPSPMAPNLKLKFDDTWKKPVRIFNGTERFRYQVTVGAGLPLRVCLAWTDVGYKSVQNRLMLMVDNIARQKFVGNANAAATYNIAGMIGDPNNNVQIVRIEKPSPGVYTIAVTAIDLVQPPQTFALVVTGDLQSNLTVLP
jgi:serine protease AprX